jgi:SagB-type dehydrogenase family enzyme
MVDLDDPKARLLLVLAPGAGLERTEDGARVRARSGEPVLERLPEAVARALELLAAGGAPLERVEQAAWEGGLEAAARLHVALDVLTRRGLLLLVVRGPEGELARLEPTSALFSLAPSAPLPERPWRLSRFAYLRRDGEVLVLESPRVRARVVLAAQALPLVASLAAPLPPRDAAARLPEPERPGGLALMALLARAGLVVEAEEGGATQEERDPRLALWEFHDLLFHARSRRHWRGQPSGATYPLSETVASLPAVQPPSGPMVELPRPDLERRRREDAPLAEVMERRRSIREPGPFPLELAQLGELLYRCARVRAVLPGERDEISSRPHPSGGARYPLELYVAARACLGLEPGLYRYEPAGHRLERRGGMTPAVEQLLENRPPGSGTPQVLLTLAARFPRVSWKYQSIAYTLVLKEAGVLLQSLSLAATAMGLASCILGSGDADVFERAAGLDGHTESSVAEMVVGSPTSLGESLEKARKNG